MRVGIAAHRATIIPPPISRRLRSIVRKRDSVSPLPDRGGPDSQVATLPADRLLSVGRRRHVSSRYAPPPSTPRRRTTCGDELAREMRAENKQKHPVEHRRNTQICLPSRGARLLTPHHGVVVRRLAMSAFESFGKQTENPRRTPPSKLQPTIGHDQFAKNVPKHGCSCPLHANLSECLRDVDLTQRYACARPKATTRIQDTPDNISQHATQLYGGGLREIRVSIHATCILRRPKRLYRE